MTILNSPVQVLQKPRLEMSISFTSTAFAQVPYDSESLQFIAETRGVHVAAALQQPMPAGAHFRLPTPASVVARSYANNCIRVWGGERSNIVLLLWEVWHSMLKTHFQDQASPAEISGMELPLSLLDHDLYPDAVLRALSILVPGLQQYWKDDAGVKFPRPTVDGGYYTRTPENMPLIGNRSRRFVWNFLTAFAGPAPLRGGSDSSQVHGMFVCGALR